MISPREVVEKMSFSRKGEGSSSSSSPLRSPPPAAAPPPPPDEHQHEDDDNKNKKGGVDESDPLLSYQHGGGTRSTREEGKEASAAAGDFVPTIRHYDEDDGNNSGGASSFFRNNMAFFRGDASLKPNRGLTNVYDTAILGLALHEILDYIRLANIIAATFSMALLLTTWLFRLVTFQWCRLVLSGYLGFLSFVLLVVELMTIWNVSAAADEWLKDNFGLLRHPVGKSIFIYMLATLCFGIGGLAELIVGCLYFASATFLLVVWFYYPEFREPFEQEDKQAEEDLLAKVAAEPNAPSASWSQYSTSFSSYVKGSTTTASSSEKTSLLKSKQHQSV